MKYAVGFLVAFILAGAVYILFLSNADFFVVAPEGVRLKTLSLFSPAFKDGEQFPEKYTCDTNSGTPPLLVSGIPEGTVSLVLTMEGIAQGMTDVDAFDHLVLYSIPVPEGQKELGLPEGALPGALGLSGNGAEAYVTPCPEKDTGEREYVFSVYALSTELSFFVPPKKSEVLSGMSGYVIDSATLTGVSP